MENYVWNIKMLNGDNYLVVSNEKDLIKFTHSIIPGQSKESISTFELATDEIVYKCKSDERKFN